MATTVAAAAATAENPKIHSDLSLDPPTREDAASTQSPPISGAGADALKAEADAVAAKTSGVDGGSTATDIEKKMKRAERFGVAVQLSEKEKRNSRAERFGTAAPVKEVDSSKEDLKRKARAERFGTVSATVSADDDVKKKARLARFGSSAPADSVDEEKKKARAIRFSQVDSSSKLNGEGKVEGKMAMAGKAGGGT